MLRVSVLFLEEVVVKTLVRTYAVDCIFHIPPNYVVECVICSDSYPQRHESRSEEEKRSALLRRRASVWYV